MNKKILATLAIMPLLFGCDEKTPSERGIEKQLNSQLESCKILTMENFKKINGFPQNDGSYMVDVSYDIEHKPDNKTLKTIDNYNSEKEEINSYLNENKEKYEKIMSTVSQFDCNRSFSEKLSTIETDYSDKILKLVHNLPQNDDYDYRQWLQNFIMNIPKGSENMRAEDIPLFAKNLREYVTQINAKIDNEVDDVKTTAYKNSVSLINELIKSIETIEPDFAMCLANNDKFEKDNAQFVSKFQEKNNELSSINDSTLKNLRKTLDDSCSMTMNNYFSGVLMEMSYNYFHNIDGFAKEIKYTVSKRIHMVKSDNGWIIQQ